MAADPTEYIKAHRISTDSIANQPYRIIKSTGSGVKKGFDVVLDQLESVAGGITKAGKTCLSAINPFTHIASLYRAAQTALITDTDTSAEEELKATLNPETALSRYQTLSGEADLFTAPDSSKLMQEALSIIQDQQDQAEGQLGSIAAKYESGSQGIDAIGYDRQGGTSYGTYQISSRAGTMAQFINYLKDEAPEWARRLQACGRANTGSTRGRMPREWAQIAAEDPARFEKLQYNFIKESHYEQALGSISADKGFDIAGRSAALKEALWSTSVQHGPRGAAIIFGRAIDRLSQRNGEVTDKALINEIYTRRANYFRSSTRQVRNAVRQRFHDEKMVVLAKLQSEAGTEKV